MKSWHRTPRRPISRLARASRPAPTSRLRVGLLAVSLVVGSLLVAIGVASPVWQASFRMQAQTDFIGFTVKGDARLAFNVTDWELRGFRASQATQDAPFSVARAAEGERAVAERVDLWLREGNVLTMLRLPDRAGRPRFALSLPVRQVPVAVQLTHATAPPLKSEREGESRPMPADGAVRGEIGGRDEAALVFSIAHPSDETRPRVAVSSLGFGRPLEDGRVYTGLQGGSLLFLDKPDAEVRLWRGTDLRMQLIDAELAAILLSAGGIEVQIDGLTSDATMHVGSSPQLQRMRRVMPTHYDKLKGEPVIAVLLGFFGVLSGIAGLMLSAAQVSAKVAVRVRQLGGE